MVINFMVFREYVNALHFLSFSKKLHIKVALKDKELNAFFKKGSYFINALHFLAYSEKLYIKVALKDKR